MYLSFTDCTVCKFDSCDTLHLPPTTFAVSTLQIAPDVHAPAHRNCLSVSHFAEDLKFLRKNVKLPALLKRQSVYFGGQAAIEKHLFQCVTQRLFSQPILTEADYNTRVNELTELRVHQCGQDLRDAVIAVVEARPLLITCVTSSKYPAPTKDWCLTAR